MWRLCTLAQEPDWRGESCWARPEVRVRYPWFADRLCYCAHVWIMEHSDRYRYGFRIPGFDEDYVTATMCYYCMGTGEYSFNRREWEPESCPYCNGKGYA